MSRRLLLLAAGIGLFTACSNPWIVPQPTPEEAHEQMTRNLEEVRRKLAEPPLPAEIGNVLGVWQLDASPREARRMETIQQALDGRDITDRAWRQRLMSLPPDSAERRRLELWVKRQHDVRLELRPTTVAVRGMGPQNLMRDLRLEVVERKNPTAEPVVRVVYTDGRSPTTAEIRLDRDGGLVWTESVSGAEATRWVRPPTEAPTP